MVKRFIILVFAVAFLADLFALFVQTNRLASIYNDNFVLDRNLYDCRIGVILPDGSKRCVDFRLKDFQYGPNRSDRHGEHNIQQGTSI